MIKNLLFSFTFFMLCQVCLSQQAHEFVGAVKLSDSLSITYRLNLTDNNGKVTGYSITDIGGEHETRSNIFGEYNHSAKELSFRETDIVYTKSAVSQEDFCFINFTTKSFVFGKTTGFRGKFFGLFSDNTACIHGELIMNSIEKMQNRIAKVSKKINKSKNVHDSIKQKFNSIKLMDTIQMNMLKSNKTLSVFSKSKKVNLILFDGGQEDGDIVTIKVNGKIVLNNYKISHQKKIVPIQLLDKFTKVSIHAVSVGTISTNTAVVEIEDGNNSIRALTNLKIDESTMIDFLLK